MERDLHRIVLFLSLRVHLAPITVEYLTMTLHAGYMRTFGYCDHLQASVVISRGRLDNSLVPSGR